MGKTLLIQGDDHGAKPHSSIACAVYVSQSPVAMSLSRIKHGASVVKELGKQCTAPWQYHMQRKGDLENDIIVEIVVEGKEKRKARHSRPESNNVL